MSAHYADVPRTDGAGIHRETLVTPDNSFFDPLPHQDIEQDQNQHQNQKHSVEALLDAYRGGHLRSAIQNSWVLADKGAKQENSEDGKDDEAEHSKEAEEEDDEDDEVTSEEHKEALQRLYNEAQEEEKSPLVHELQLDPVDAIRIYAAKSRSSSTQRKWPVAKGLVQDPRTQKRKRVQQPVDEPTDETYDQYNIDPLLRTPTIQQSQPEASVDQPELSQTRYSHPMTDGARNTRNGSPQTPDVQQQPKTGAARWLHPLSEKDFDVAAKMLELATVLVPRTHIRQLRTHTLRDLIKPESSEFVEIDLTKVGWSHLFRCRLPCICGHCDGIVWRRDRSSLSRHFAKCCPKVGQPPDWQPAAINRIKANFRARDIPSLPRVRKLTPH